MEAALFKQMRDDINLSEKKQALYSLIILIVLTVSFLLADYLSEKNNIEPGLGFVIALVFAFSITFIFLRDKVKEKDVIGEVKFEKTSISFMKEGVQTSIRTEKLSAISIKYNYILGEQLFGNRDITHNGLTLLALKTKTGETIEVKLVIEKQSQIDSLIPIWKEYYRQNLKIKERLLNKQTICFKRKLSNEAIQDLKNELGVSSFD